MNCLTESGVEVRQSDFPFGKWSEEVIARRLGPCVLDANVDLRANQAVAS
jgi:hypothetical protein